MELNADGLREAYKRHSTPKEKGGIPLSEDDFKNIPKYVDEFDGIISIDTYNNRIEIQLYKESDTGYMRIITVSSKEREALQVIKLIGVSKEKFESKYAKKIERDTGSSRGLTEISVDPTPSTKARHTAGALSDIRITQDNDKVKQSDVLKQDRASAPITNRALLANALESTTQDETELTRLREYRMSIDYLNEQEAKLTELRSQIREISFGKGPRDTARLKQLQEEANKTATRINEADKKLLCLEAAKPLQRVLERERRQAVENVKIKDVKYYAKLAVEVKDKYPSLAQTLYNISVQEDGHQSAIHNEVVKIIEEHRRAHGDPPATMMAVYEYLHKKSIDKLAEARLCQEMYKKA